MFMGPTQAGSYVEGAKSQSIQATSPGLAYPKGLSLWMLVSKMAESHGNHAGETHPRFEHILCVKCLELEHMINRLSEGRVGLS